MRMADRKSSRLDLLLIEVLPQFTLRKPGEGDCEGQQIEKLFVTALLLLGVGSKMLLGSFSFLA